MLQKRFEDACGIGSRYGMHSDCYGRGPYVLRISGRCSDEKSHKYRCSDAAETAHHVSRILQICEGARQVFRGGDLRIHPGLLRRVHEGGQIRSRYRRCGEHSADRRVRSLPEPSELSRHPSRNARLSATHRCCYEERACIYAGGQAACDSDRVSLSRLRRR